MKGHEIVNHIVRMEMPDIERVRETCILQADTHAKQKNNVWAKRLIPAVACVAVILTAVLAFPNLISNPDNGLVAIKSGETNTPAVTSNQAESSSTRDSSKYIPADEVVDGFTSDSVASYATPDNGTQFCFVEVNDALKEYAGQDVKYFLALDIFSDKIQLESDSGEIKTELERLTALGYHVGYAECWEYQDKGEQIYYIYVAGYFTAKEIENFLTSENYGYAFRFATNGDSSPVPAEQGIITDFNGFNE